MDERTNVKITVEKVWKYRTKRIAPSLRFPRKFFANVWEAIDEADRDNHIVVSAHIVDTSYGGNLSGRYYFWFSDLYCYVAEQRPGTLQNWES